LQDEPAIVDVRDVAFLSKSHEQVLKIAQSRFEVDVVGRKQKKLQKEKQHRIP
jgi:hypothetical protein